MDFSMSERQTHWLDRVVAFMDAHVYPAIPVYDAQGRGGRTLESHPDHRGTEGEGAAPRACGICSCRRTRSTTKATITAPD